VVVVKTGYISRHEKHLLIWCNVVQNDPMSTKTSPPISKPQKIRLTISVTPEVHAAFSRIATAGNMSLGNAMGEWLGDTIEAAEYMATTMERARAAPKVVIREMHAYALGLSDETGELMRSLAKKGEADRASQRSGAAGPLPPSFPVSNTGRKVPPTTKAKSRNSASPNRKTS